MPPELRASYLYCRDLARRAGNFYYAFLTLPADRFWAMCALYGFTRLVDDAADDTHLPPEDRARLLQDWRQSLQSSLAQQAISIQPPQSLVFPAILETLRKFQIPPQFLFDVIDGVESDLQPVQFETFEDLSQYCYRVAGVIGLSCIHIWGFTDPQAIPAAIAAGEAFQLTNILRDLKEDFANGRCYLPRRDLAEHHCSIDDLARGTLTPPWRNLLAFEVARARQLYQRGNELNAFLTRVGRPPFRTMVRLYEGLLNEIERADYDVFSRRIRVPTWKKMQFALNGIWEQYTPWVPRS